MAVLRISQQTDRDIYICLFFTVDRYSSLTLRITGHVLLAEIRHVRLPLPAQPGDATPSDQLIRQYFPPGRTDLSGGA